MKTNRLKKLISIAAVAMCGFSLFCVADGTENGNANTDGVTVPEDAPTLEGLSKLILTVDQYGNLSSTNAIATSADLAVVAASNQLAIAVQEANNEGYKVATNLINEVAASVASSPIVFCSAEISSFVAATVFDELTSKMRIFKWNVDNVFEDKTIVVDGVPATMRCQRITCGYTFTSDISVLQPQVKYIEHLDGTPTSDWNFLNEGLVGPATPVQHETYIDDAGTQFTDFYEIPIWVPADRSTGFFRVVVQNEAPDVDGNTLDTVGVKDGYTGVVTNGTMVLNIKGGYIMKTGTEQVPPQEPVAP